MLLKWKYNSKENGLSTVMVIACRHKFAYHKKGQFRMAINKDALLRLNPIYYCSNVSYNLRAGLHSSCMLEVLNERVQIF